MGKLTSIILLIGALLVLESFAAVKLPIYRRKNNNLLKRANTPLGGGISTDGEFFVQLQGKSNGTKCRFVFKRIFQYSLTNKLT